MNQSIRSPFCGSIYEDAPLNYLIDYAFVNGGLRRRPTYRSTPGLGCRGEKIFYYQYPTMGCNTAYNSIPDSFGKYKVSDSGASSAQPLYSGARFGR